MNRIYFIISLNMTQVVVFFRIRILLCDDMTYDDIQGTTLRRSHLELDQHVFVDVVIIQSSTVKLTSVTEAQ